MFENLFGKRYDFIAIGETTIDAFIRLQEASVDCDKNGENCRLSIQYGTKIPYEFVVEVPAVGNAANASVAGSRLGAKSALVANIGKDRNGQTCLDSLQKDGVSTEFIQICKDKTTNYHYVLWFKDDRTILQKHSDFDYKFPNIGEPRWIYLTSLGEKSLGLHQQIAEFLKKHPAVKMAFQPGIFQIKMGYEKLRDIYENASIVFCNKEEAATIVNIPTTDIKTLAVALHGKGSKTVVITDGPKGAYAYDEGKLYFIPPYPDPKPPYDRTGAGDAFSSTFAVARMMGKSVEEALMWAPINSMSVVQEIGAQKGLLSQTQIMDYLKRAPADYQVKII
ncbi:MAG TPA: carbohydrate kinase family protein [Candidatus Paceibacterota bacterium]